MFLSVPDYLALPRHQNVWIVEDLLPVGGSLNIFGKPKAGKSLLTLQLISCISDAKRSEFLGFPIHTHGRVAYVQLDTSRGIWTTDLTNAQSLGYDFTNVYNADKEMVPHPFHIEGWHALKHALSELQPLVVVVDTVRKTHLGDENMSDIMAKVWIDLEYAIRPAACIIISHARKGNPAYGEELMSENRGSNFIAGEVDVVMNVRKSKKSGSSVMYEGRSADERTLKCKRIEHGYWDIDHDEIDAKVKQAIATKGTRSEREIARELSNECGITFEAARKRLQRTTK